MSASRFFSLLFQSFNVSFQQNSHEKGSDEFCVSGCGKRTLFGIKKKGKRRSSMRNEVLPNNGETLKTQSWNFRGAWQMWRGLGERSTLWNIYQVYILCIESKMGKCRGKKKRQMLSWTHSWELETDIVKAQKRPRGRYYRYKMLINSIEKKRTIISSLFCVQRQICSTWGLHCYFSFFFF